MQAFAVVAAMLALAAPGWKALLADLEDGRIDGVYPCSTYRAALRHLPPGEDASAVRARVRAGRCLADEAPAKGRNYAADGVAVGRAPIHALDASVVQVGEERLPP